MTSEPIQKQREKIQRMRVLMLQTATKMRSYDDGGEYSQIWTSLMEEGALERAPEIVKVARTLSEFDSSIRSIGGYAERRDAIEKGISDWLMNLGQRDSRAATSASERYTLHEQIGDGGFAHVYEATDNELGRKVAIKLFKPGNTDFSSAHSHARALARVTHTNVVTIFEFTTLRHPKENDERSAIVMEFLSGPELVSVLKGSALDKNQARTLCTGILFGLREIHDAGLIHADLHDENIKLDKHGVPKILDILYRGTLALKPPGDREEFFRGDLHRASSLLRQILVHALQVDESEEFRRLAVNARSVTDLENALIQALDSTVAAKHEAVPLPDAVPQHDGSQTVAQPSTKKSELLEWFDESLGVFEAEQAAYRQHSGRDLFGRGSFFSAYLLDRPIDSTVNLPTLRDHLEKVGHIRETQHYPFLCRLDGTRLAKKGSCIQNLIDIKTVLAGTFMRASTRGQVFAAGTLTEDFASRYNARFVLDPYESLGRMVRSVEHARRFAVQQGFLGRIHIMFRHRGLLNRELAFWSPRLGVANSYGLASEDQITALCSFDTDGSALSAGEILEILRSPLDDVLMNFDLCAIGQAGMPGLSPFEAVADRALRGEVD